MKSDNELTLHNHLCRDCGALLHASNAPMSYCEELADHKIEGRCEVCWSKIGQFWALEHADAYGTEITRAAHIPDEGRFARWYACRAIGAVGETRIELAEIGWQDLEYFGTRRPDGSFPGCSNAAWVLTRQDMDHFLRLNQDRFDAKLAEKAAAKEAEKLRVDTAIEQSRATGKPAEINRWVTDGCTRHLEECSFDLAIHLALPDGTIKVEYVHAF